MTKREQADYILYDMGLLRELKKYGTPHIIGSCRMDMMAWNDLDIDIENDSMSIDKLYELSDYIIHKFHPTWYEAKEERNAENKTVWFHGFEMYVNDELWNVDLWFFDKETISKAEKYCDDIADRVKREPKLKESIINIKKELISRGIYSFDKYTSMDVYDAVLNQHISTINEFLSDYSKR